MDAVGTLKDQFDRMAELAHGAVDGLSREALAKQPEGRGNSIAWLVWHAARVQDDHVADAAGSEQVWTSQGFAERSGLPFEASETGYGFGPEQVASVALEGELLTTYLEAVVARTSDYLGTLSDADLDRVVDESWDPPVTLGVRLGSVVGDDLQHLGQAAYVRGLLA